MPKKLQITKAEVNFTYSCIPTVDGDNLSFKTLFGESRDSERQDQDVVNYTGFSFSDKEAELQNANYFKQNPEVIEALKKYDPIKFKRYRPHCRKGISPYLSLDLDMGFIRPDLELSGCRLKYNEDKYPNIDNFKKFQDETTHPNPDITIDIKPIIRLFPNGVSCTLKVIATSESDKIFHEEEVYKILHLVGMNKNCPGSYLLEYDATSYNFDIDVFDENEETQKFFYRSKNTVRFTLANLFKILIERLLLDPIKTKFNVLYPGAEVNLLCRKHLLRSNAGKNSFQTKESQSPWVITNIELNQSCFNEISQLSHDHPPQILGTTKAANLKDYSQAITPLVYRSPDLKLSDFSFDPTYYHYSEWESDYLPLYSIHFDNRLFVQMSRRSILTLSSPDGINKKYPGKYFIPGLLDISEFVRVRWQTLILLNYMSDQEIRKIKSKNSTIEFKQATEEDADYNTIINQMYQLTTCLDSPSSYVVSGDALREIQERMIDTFRLQELTSVVLKKAQVMDSLRSLSIRKRALEIHFGDDKSN